MPPDEDMTTGLRRWTTTLGWPEARRFHDAGPAASTTERPVLDFAGALGGNRFKIVDFYGGAAGLPHPEAGHA